MFYSRTADWFCFVLIILQHAKISNIDCCSLDIQKLCTKYLHLEFDEHSQYCSVNASDYQPVSLMHSISKKNYARCWPTD
jgi:hypothetical protein